MSTELSKKIYFLSDFHLGAPNAAESLVREKKIVDFLEKIRKDAVAVFIVGDMFDFWYEYRKVVPKGYVRLLGKLAELTDSGIAVHFFVGNHDMWMDDYLQKELNIPVYFEPQTFEFSGQTFFIGHGDGLGPGDRGYKMLKKVFRNPVCRWLFGILPPFIGISLADYFSRKSREATGKHEEIFLGEDKEWLITYSRELLSRQHYDYLVFGHRHLPMDIMLQGQNPPAAPGNSGRPGAADLPADISFVAKNKETRPSGNPEGAPGIYRMPENTGSPQSADAGPPSRYINLGDWITYFTYAVFDGQHLTLRSRYPENEEKIIRR